MIGDKITAVDGELVAGRHVSQVLTPGAESYTFTVRRDAAEAAAAIERVLLELSTQAAAGTPGLEDKAKELMGALEAAADQPSSAEMSERILGFWRLRYTSGDDGRFTSAGLSGFGAAPYCTLLGQFQCFTKPDDPTSPSAQTVEVISNSNLGSSNLVTLKGDFSGVASEEDSSALVTETYDRLDYSGTPQLGEVVEHHWQCGFIGASLRVCKVDGCLLLYERMDALDAQEAIGRLLSARVAPATDDMPRWQRADLERGLSNYEGPTQSGMVP